MLSCVSGAESLVTSFYALLSVIRRYIASKGKLMLTRSTVQSPNEEP
jgi:hypothetical protein